MMFVKFRMWLKLREAKKLGILNEVEYALSDLLDSKHTFDGRTHHDGNGRFFEKDDNVPNHVVWHNISAETAIDRVIWGLVTKEQSRRNVIYANGGTPKQIAEDNKVAAGMKSLISW